MEKRELRGDAKFEGKREWRPGSMYLVNKIQIWVGCHVVIIDWLISDLGTRCQSLGLVVSGSALKWDCVQILS